MPDTEEKVIQTAEVKQKLLSNPMSNEHLNLFCAFLAERLNEDMVPIGFVMAFALAAGDLDRGTDGFTEQPIQHRLARQGLGNVFLLALDAVAAKVLPADFCADVRAEWKEVKTSLINK